MYDLVQNTNSSINKKLQVFLAGIEKEKNIRFFDDEITFDSFFNNRMLVFYAIQQGIPYNLYKEIKEIAPFTETDWASFLDLSTKSLQRYRLEKNHIFKSIHSEKILELAEVTNLGYQVFDEPEHFYLWLKTPSVALGNLKPVELLKDSYGKELVLNELGRINEGIFV